MRSRWLLTTLIMLGLLAGIVVGHFLHDPDFTITMSDNEHAHATTVVALHFVGDTVFLGLLKMIIIPLIATSVIVGVTSVGDFRELGRIGFITLVYYVATMLIAAGIGLVLVSTIRPGDKVTSAQLQEAQQTYDASEAIKANIEQGPKGMLGALSNLVRQIIPTNIVRAAADGQALPVIFFS
ncbi:MAG: dicarboxylate/amino acid:cation symporter, partial [Planctomycetes bacterium]|nr:dicarboxylate/amino acid:cation symporter [Planctomycetota bacterium]